MTNHELDAMMKRILVDSISQDCEAMDQDGNLAFQPSARHQRQIRLMLKDPLGWARKKARPMWKTIAQRAAVVLLIISLGFGTVLVSSPTARAAFVRWITEWYDTYMIYRFAGENLSGEMPQFEITELPEGFVETERIEFPESTTVTYENETGDFIDFTYIYMSQGGASAFETENSDVYDIEVNHMNGLFAEAKIPGNFNTIAWIDTEQNIQFDISGLFSYMDIMHMAESVSLYKTTK